jgi:uncharacterized RmlC-like cupin family protein
MKTSITILLVSFFLFSYTSLTSGSESGDPVQSEYSVVTQGSRELLRPDGSDFVKILVESANLGGNEVELAEITFGPNYRGSGHPHGSMEIFYVLSGGMVGIVRAGDIVEHINQTGTPVKTLVIWVPGGEIERSFGAAEMKPIDPLKLRDFSE